MKRQAELVAGFQTEYSSMPFGLFFLGEYAQHDPAVARWAPILFLGGWLSPVPSCRSPMDAGARSGSALKMLLLLFVFMLDHGRRCPRYRYDQLMRLGWKVFLPVSLGSVVITAAVLAARRLGPGV